MRYVFGDYTLDTEHYELHHGERLVRLEPRVFNLLAALVQHPGHTITKEELWAQVWPQLPNAALDSARVPNECIVRLVAKGLFTLVGKGRSLHYQLQQI